ncbi:MAG: carbohydrate kinase [Oliverpabstia sp.]
MKRWDVIGLGELLIDFTENGESSQGNPLFEANPGGAPCNVLAMLAKLGHKTAFIGKVGNDFFGKQLKEAITEVGIDAAYLSMDDQVHTTLAMVHTYPDGDRDFSFYRNPGADMMLTEDEIPEELIKDSRIFHFGTLSMTHEGVRAATKKAVRIAREAGAWISFDPNLRPPLWNDMEEAREQVLYGLEHCHILKISDNEIQWLTGKTDYTEGVEWINERYHIPLILVSMGKEGSRAYYKEEMVEVKPFLQKNTIETTGAGDTFCGCVLHYICEHGLSDLTEDNLQEMLTFANAAASLITTRKGALRVMPETEEIYGLLNTK